METGESVLEPQVETESNRSMAVDGLNTVQYALTGIMRTLARKTAFEPGRGKQVCPTSVPPRKSSQAM